MFLKTSTGVGSIIIVLISIFQACTASPIVAITDAIDAGTATAITARATLAGDLGGEAIISGLDTNDKSKRATGYAARYPVANKACQNQLRSATVTVRPAGNKGARFDGVPSACMTLATVFLGENADPNSSPIPLGAASLLYNQLTRKELRTLTQALRAKSKTN